MTTIACTPKIMAGDSLATDDTRSSVTKIWRVAGGVLGVAGPYCYGHALYLHLSGEADAPVMKGLAALWIDGKRIWCYDECITAYVIDDPYAAIGSGGMAALACLIRGDSPTDAVRTAIKVDPWSGGKVRTLEV